MQLLQTIICAALWIYLIILIARIILSWIPNLHEPLRPLARGIHAATDPVLVPLRSLLPPLQTGAVAFDLSPILVFFGLYILIALFGC